MRPEFATPTEATPGICGSESTESGDFDRSVPLTCASLRLVEWPLLASLSEPERAAVIALSRRRTFAKGDIVCHEGDPADSFHLIERGRMAVRVSLPTGDAAMINVLGAGETFGEMALLHASVRRTATIVTLEASSTLAISGSEFHRLCEARPGVQRAVSEVLATRVDELSHRVLELMYVGLDRRVYRRLLDLAHRYQDERVAGPIVVPFTQSQLADLTGGTRPSVNKALQRLVDEGAVSLGRGRIEIHDLGALRRRHGT